MKRVVQCCYFVRNILCVAKFVTSSLAVFETAIQVKLTHLLKIMFEKQKKEKIWK